MIFSSKATPRWHRVVAGFLAAAALALVASCGGSTTQYDPFVPKRLIVFGDDLSTLAQDGRKYAVNGLDANSAIDCSVEPIWVQSMASLYGFAFAECNPTAVAEPQALMRAFAGAKAADVTAQVEAQVAAGGFRDKDLATVLVGMNDLLELYAQFPGRAEADLAAEAGARGRQVAAVVNRLVDLGVKVVVSDLPDLGLTPLALKQVTLSGDTDRAALMTRLTTAFNEQLGVNVVLDGRFVGLVQSQLRFQAIARSPAAFGLTNITSGACAVPLPLCTTATLATDALAGTYLWADDTRLSSGGQQQLATLGMDRAQRNPF